MGWLADGIDLVTALARAVHEEKIRYPAAALAYYAFVSFVPLLLLVFVVIGEQLASELSQTAPQFLTPEAHRLVGRSLTTASGRTGAGLLAVLVLGWSSANVVADIRTVVKRIEGPIEGSPRSWTRDAIGILGGLGLAILGLILTSTFFELPPSGPFFGLAGGVTLWLALTVAFVPLYYLPSGLVASPTAALPGAGTASLGWTILHTAVLFYTGHADQYAVYGVLSGVIIILTSLYLAATVLLTGIIVNAWIARGSYLQN